MDLKTIDLGRILAPSLIYLILCSVASASWHQSTPVPPASGTLIDGTPFDLGKASQKGPVILYFTSTGCPVAAKANPYFDKISAAFEGSKVQFVGVVNADLKTTKSWMKNSKLRFGALSDGSYKTIKAFGVKKAPACYLIHKGKIVMHWDGWSKSILSQIITTAAKLASIAPPKVILHGAPSLTEVG